MRLHRIALRDFRGVADRELVLAETGVTLIAGPNEVGKSSIADALDMVLRLPDSSTAREVRDAVPAGRDVGPHVEVEMSTGPYRFVLAKQWSRGRMTSLDVLEPRRLQLRGREAHQWVQEALDETLDSDLWHALRVAQGTADGPVAVHTRSLAKVLDASMGLDDTGGDDDLLERIGDERALYWTATGRPRGDRVDLGRELEQLDERENDLVRQLDELSSTAARVEVLANRRAELRARRGPATARLVAVEEEHRAVTAARRQRDVAEACAERARADQRSAAEHLGRRHEALDDLAGADADVAKLVADLERCGSTADAVRIAADEVRGRLSPVEAELASLDASVRRLDTEIVRRVDVARADELRHRLSDLADVQRRSEAAEAELAALAPVDTETLSRIDARATALLRAQARLEGASATVVVRAHGELEVEIDGVVHRLAVDDVVDSLAVADLGIVIPGVADIHISPSAGAVDLAAAVDDAAAALDAACAAVGVADAEEARRVHDARLAAERRLDDARSEALRLLGRASDDDLRADAAHLDARVAELGDSPADLAERSDDDLAAAVERERAALAELSIRREDLLADLGHHEQRLEHARLEDAALAARIDQARHQRDRLAERLESARATASDASLESAAQSCLEALERSELALAAAQRAVDELEPDQVEVELARCADELTEIDAQLAETVAEADRLQARLDASGEQGLAGALDDVRSRREHVARRHAQLERKAAAALLLHDTVTAHRDAARRRYAAPYRAELERLGRLVFGPDLQIELDDDLRIERRILDGMALDVAQLSVGAREQLGLLARLACASIISGDGGVPVLFDDVLGHADPGRVTAMGRVLEAAADNSQVIVTTCTPERYASIDATRITLG